MSEESHTMSEDDENMCEEDETLYDEDGTLDDEEEQTIDEEDWTMYDADTEDAEAFQNMLAELTTYRATFKLAAENQRRSRLLQLPGELLNRIYKFCLTSDFGMQCKVPEVDGTQVHQLFPYTGKDRTTTAGVELNQLKYACRKLYQDTSGLVLRYNEIVFPEIDACATFLRRDCSAATKAEIRTITVERPCSPSNYSAVKSLAEVCAKYPKLNVSADTYSLPPGVLNFFLRNAPSSLSDVLGAAMNAEPAARKLNLEYQAQIYLVAAKANPGEYVAEKAYVKEFIAPFLPSFEKHEVFLRPKNFAVRSFGQLGMFEGDIVEDSSFSLDDMDPEMFAEVCHYIYICENVF